MAGADAVPCLLPPFLPVPPTWADPVLHTHDGRMTVLEEVTLPGLKMKYLVEV